MDGVLLAEIYELQRRFTGQIDYSFIVATNLREYDYMLIISKEYKVVKSHKIEYWVELSTLKQATIVHFSIVS